VTRSARPPGTGDAGTQTTGNETTGTQTTGTGSQENAGWTVFSYLIAGMAAYGLLGWLLAAVTHTPVLLPLGAIAGLVVAIGGVVYKYGRS